MSVLYDIRNDTFWDVMGFPDLLILAGGVFLFAVMPKSILPTYFLDRTINLVRVYFGFFLSASILVLFSMQTWQRWQQHSELARVLQAGRADVVEGFRENFRPTPEGGHGPQSFDVAKRHFSFWETWEVPWFHGNNPIWNSTIQPTKVKLFVVNDDIVRVELSRPAGVLP